WVVLVVTAAVGPILAAALLLFLLARRRGRLPTAPLWIGAAWCLVTAFEIPTSVAPLWERWSALPGVQWAEAVAAPAGRALAVAMVLALVLGERIRGAAFPVLCTAVLASWVAGRAEIVLNGPD